MIYRTTTTLTCLALLSACGGSGGGGGGPTPVMASGFASATTDYSQPYQFQDDEVVLIKLVDGEATLETVSLSFNGTPRTGPVELVLDGESYTLARDLATNELSLSTPDVSIVSDLIFATSNTGAYYIGRDTDDEFLGGYYVFGYDTNPTDIERLNGNANYIGEANITLRNNENVGFGSGTVNLAVNFDSATIGGDIAVSDNLQQGTSLTFPEIMITLNETSISENGFSGSTEAQTEASGDVFNNGTYSGRFYEDNAAVAAGQFSGTIDAPGVENTLPYEGVFVAEK